MPRLLLLGCGAFGRVHLAALDLLGLGPSVSVYDPDPTAAAATGRTVTATLKDGLASCDAVIIASPVQTHVALTTAALRAGRDVFLEKPATETAAEASQLAAMAAASGRIVQVGLYFRFHPKARALHAMVAQGDFGKLHYLAARFSGLKRARGDSGALLNDAVHFADLLPWIASEAPSRVFCTLSDPLGRGREDFCAIQLLFPSGLIGFIEAGCVLPGRWPDAVVPGAETRKELLVAGHAALAEIDFGAERFLVRRGAHQPGAHGAWFPDYAAREEISAAAAEPAQVVAAELRAFLDCVAARRAPVADLSSGAVAPARILDAARRSAQEGRVVTLDEIA